MKLETIDKLEIIEPENLKIYRAQFEEAAYILKALAHETRLCVIMQLSRDDEMTVSQLREGADCESNRYCPPSTDMRGQGMPTAEEMYETTIIRKDKRITNVLKCIMV